MDDEKNNAKPPAPDAASGPVAPPEENTPELGYLELLRAPAETAAEADATDRVLSRHRHSAWDF